MDLKGCLHGCDIDKRTNRCTLCETLFAPKPLIVRRTATGTEAFEIPEKHSLDVARVVCTCQDCGNDQTLYLEDYPDEMVENYAMLIGLNRTSCCYAPMVTEVFSRDLDS
jgi:hypothetical protein